MKIISHLNEESGLRLGKTRKVLYPLEGILLVFEEHDRALFDACTGVIDPYLKDEECIIASAWIGDDECGYEKCVDVYHARTDARAKMGRKPRWKAAWNASIALGYDFADLAIRCLEAIANSTNDWELRGVATGTLSAVEELWDSPPKGTCTH